jgi:hypothetical protein
MYPISSPSMIIREKIMVDYINKYNYLVIFPDKKIELFKSLRDIQNSISIDSSTISKKLKNNEHLFTAKGTEYVFYIQTLK